MTVSFHNSPSISEGYRRFRMLGAKVSLYVVESRCKGERLALDQVAVYTYFGASRAASGMQHQHHFDR